MEQKLTYLSVYDIDPHPHNPRGPVDPASIADLVESIKEKDVIEPVIVVAVRDPGQTWKIERYIMIAGHRRLEASKQAGRTTIPAIIRDLSPIEQEEFMLTENLQREDLSPLQEARAYKRLVDQGKYQSDIARSLGVVSSRIAQRLYILQLPPPVQQLYGTRELPITLTAELLKIESPERQIRIAQMVASRQISVGKVKDMVTREAERVITDRAVDRDRKKRRERPQPEPPPPIYTKLDAVQELEATPDVTLTYADLLQAFNETCERCGLATHPEICAGCPLPQFIRGLMRRHELQAQAV